MEKIVYERLSQPDKMHHSFCHCHIHECHNSPKTPFFIHMTMFDNFPIYPKCHFQGNNLKENCCAVLLHGCCIAFVITIPANQYDPSLKNSQRYVMLKTMPMSSYASHHLPWGAFASVYQYLQVHCSMSDVIFYYLLH